MVINIFEDSVEDIKYAPSSFSFILAAATNDGKVYLIDLNEIGTFNKKHVFQPAYKGVSCISWNKCSYEPQILAVGCKGSKEQKDNLLTLWVNMGNTWKKFHSFINNNSNMVNVLDVSWSLLNGRYFN